MKIVKEALGHANDEIQSGLKQGMYEIADAIYKKATEVSDIEELLEYISDIMRELEG